MKKIFFYILTMTAVLLGMSACKGNEPVQPSGEKAKYTIIVYGNPAAVWIISLKDFGSAPNR